MEKTPALACLVILLKRIVATFESFKCNNGPARLFRVKALEVMVSTGARTCVCVCESVRVCMCVGSEGGMVCGCMCA